MDLKLLIIKIRAKTEYNNTYLKHKTRSRNVSFLCFKYVSCFGTNFYY